MAKTHVTMKVNGAEVEGLHFADLVAAARQHHDGNALVALAQQSQQVQTLHVRKAEIEDDQVRVLR